MKNIDKIKILLIVTQSEFGGAQRYVFELISYLNEEKYDILVAAGHGDGELFEKLKGLNAKTIQLNHLKRSLHPLQIIFSISEIIKLFKKERPDILFLCSTTAGLVGSIASHLFKMQDKKHKIRVIYRIGGWAFNDPRNWTLNKLILTAEKITASLKDEIIVNSEFDYQIAIKNKICPPSKIIKIYNGIDNEKLKFLPRNEARESLSKKAKEPLNVSFLIGCVANFYKTKGINYLIEAMNLLEAKYGPLDAKCVVIGDGKQRPELEKLIKILGLEDKVFLVGRIPDAYKYLKTFDIFVLPSLKEGFPWIILEAMAAQIPVIATKVGALPEILENNKQGILVKPKNPEQIAEQIKRLIDSPELVRILKIQAKQKLKKFSVLKMLQETESLF